MKKPDAKILQAAAAAIQKDDVAKLKALLDDGLSVNQKIEGRLEPQSLLEVACEKGSLACCQVLVKAGAKMESKDHPLILAILFTHFDIAKLLLESGADPNTTLANPDENDCGLTPLMFAAEDEKSLPFIDLLIKHGADLQLVTKRGHSALYKAVDRGNLRVAEKLLTLGCKADGKILLGPIYRGELEMVRKLIAAGADVNAIGDKNTCLTRRTALEGAVKERAQNFDLVSSMENRIETLDELEKKKLPERQTQSRNYLEIVKTLVRAGANVNHPTIWEAPLYLAAAVGDVEVIHLLLAAGATTESAKDIFGNTALHAAVQSGIPQAIELLLAAGADRTAKNQEGFTALEQARQLKRSKQIDMWECARRHGMQVDQKILDPLYAAWPAQHAAILQALEREKNYELRHFANPDQLAAAAATLFLDEVERVNHAGRQLSVALSGGRIANNFFDAIVKQATHRKAVLQHVHFFWADERCVPPDDAESNYKTANELLFTPLKISATQIHRIHGEDAPEVAAEKATRDILGLLRPRSDGQPILDLIFLGIGPDGHTASLPGEPEAIRETKNVYRSVNNSPKPPPKRVTLGYSAIAAAQQVVVLVSGDGKEKVFTGSLQHTMDTPFAIVLKSRAMTIIFSDIRKK